ncbi:hypothetical protein TREMEDRAFT_64680 [Tremella mesenterica DSM 1558]|uniref:uncharacterized protein n=1 Tax=Tremella mesenterica (strain ATCC 24925 / CBS 8224 / DSM 1558 / NBRC 9311 / NRRL Y-6157 / RJB 2259-6 / UBC 559-6) TaxID=578456 RepID=UPI0003F49930|nr:uncharacterized protein TREMEDRAFT_64680 [Tremella mesenterica DSM 1558]EIW67424.1 hypothetical protein TREMEDRAFT_64680 [Tremella mesenterica DSM 1558]
MTGQVDREVLSEAERYERSEQYIPSRSSREQHPMTGQVGRETSSVGEGYGRSEQYIPSSENTQPYHSTRYPHHHASSVEGHRPNTELLNAPRLQARQLPFPPSNLEPNNDRFSQQNERYRFSNIRPSHLSSDQGRSSIPSDQDRDPIPISEDRTHTFIGSSSTRSDLRDDLPDRPRNPLPWNSGPGPGPGPGSGSSRQDELSYQHEIHQQSQSGQSSAPEQLTLIELTEAPRNSRVPFDHSTPAVGGITSQGETWRSILPNRSRLLYLGHAEEEESGSD